MIVDISEPDEPILRFLLQQTCATICFVNDQGKPCCFNCFYAFNNSLALLYFKSSPASYHSGLLQMYPDIAGTVLPDKLNKLQVKGLQFEGRVLPHDHPLTRQASGLYLKTHPMSIAIPGEIWTIQLNRIKLTDSTLGFGKKINWTRAALSMAAG